MLKENYITRFFSVRTIRMFRVKHQAYCLILLSFCVLNISSRQYPFRPGRRVCSSTKRTLEIVPMNQTYARPFYNTRCNNTQNCTRIYYKVTYRTVFYRRIVHDIVRHCCPGWLKRDPRDVHCSFPVCKSECENGGKCIGPDQCLCPKNFTGMKCQKDIDECSRGLHNCQQVCTNTHGGYKCSCFDGFVLAGKHQCQFCPVCLPAFEDMMNKVNDLQNRIVTVEKEKEKLMENLTSIENHYAAAMHQVEELREVTIRTLTPSKPVETTPSQMKTKLDVISSLSEQISLLEEKIGSCDCAYGSNRYVRRRYRTRG